jgi:protoheme IX farnesyltransferase
LALFQYFYTLVFTPLKTTSLSVFVGAFQDNPFYVGLGCHGRIGIEAGTLFLIQFFGSSTFLGYWMVLYDDYEGWFLYVAYRQKTRHSVTDYFIHRLVDLASLLPVFGYTGRLFITVAAVVVFLLGLLLFLRSKIV